MKLNNFEKQVLEEMKNFYNENKKHIGYSTLKKKLGLKNIFPDDKLLNDALTKLCNIGFVKLNSDPDNFGFEVQKWN